jgi:hypothetical protein
MRALIVGVAALAAACSADVSEDRSPAAGGGYMLEVRATQGEQTYLVTAPDGRVVAARAAEGASALMDADRALAFAGDPPPQGEVPPEVMSMRVPGFEMKINADEENAAGDNGRVAMSIGGSGGTNIVVNANEGGPGEADDHAQVRITGADEEAVRDFIQDAEELSPEVKAQMLAELGIDAAQQDETQP